MKPMFALAVLAAAATGFGAAKVHSRSQMTCSGVPCDHLSARVAAIEADIFQNEGTRTYLALGDSITERADLPQLCGREAINAGIGWAKAATFGTLGKQFAEAAKPDFILVALGTNDAVFSNTAFEAEMTALLASLKPAKVIIVSPSFKTETSSTQAVLSAISRIPTPKTSGLDRIEAPDGIHLSKNDYVRWKQAITSATTEFICPELKAVSASHAQF